MPTNEQKKNSRGIFHGPMVWSGIAMAVVGSLLGELTGSLHAFEVLLVIGGAWLGIGCERNRVAAASSGDTGPEDAA